MSYQAFAVWLSRVAGVVACLACSAAWAQLPASRLNSVFPPGGARGSSVEVTLSGTDLDLVEKLHFSHPGLSAAPKTRDPKPFEEGPQPVPNVFVVTIASDVPPGTYDVRAVGKFGISNARTFAVSDLTETLETEPNDTAETAQEVPLGVVNARSNRAADVDWFKFNAKAGQRLIIQVLGQQIDSPIDATITLYDAQGQQIDADRDTNGKRPADRLHRAGRRHLRAEGQRLRLRRRQRSRVSAPDRRSPVHRLRVSQCGRAWQQGQA
jgi:Bacterial pre-peptidase C-terminal domain.